MPPSPSGRRRRRKRSVPSTPPAGGAQNPKPGQPAKPKAVPAKPTAIPAKPKAVPAKPTAIPAKPKAVPAKPTAVPAKPTAVPAAPEAAAPKPVTPARPKAVPPRSAAPAKPKAKAPAPKSTPPKSTPPKDGGSAALKPKAIVDPLIGTTVGRCKIEERVGAGRTAVVYRVHYEALDQTVALKVLQPETAAMPELVDRFKSEARAIAKIDNENVLKIYDVGSEDAHHYMVVELLEGEEILDLIEREGQVDPTDALRIVRQAANGLAAAHAKGIIHRDVKPQNLFLLEDGTVKVVDFGLAGRYSDSSQRVGTPHYMAPEVCESGNADLGSDVYALGIVLYHLLVGQPPYAGMSIQEIMRAHIAAEPLRPERHVPGMDKDVAELVRTLTKSDPLIRPTTGDILPMLDAIGGKELKEKSSLRGRRRSRSLAAVTRREKQGKKGAMPLVLAGLGAAALIGLVLALATGNDNPGKPAETASRGNPRPSNGTSESVAPAFTGKDAESPGEVLAREREEKKRQKEAEERKRESDAMDALKRAEVKAREVWKSDADTDAVLAHYRSVSRRFKKTEAAKEAKARVREIKTGKRHPHPDRRYSTADAVATAKKALKDALPLVAVDIAKHEYGLAKGRLPGRINDATGRLAVEIEFWHAHTRRLANFKESLGAGILEYLKDNEELEFPGDDKEARIVGATGASFSVRRAGKTKQLDWHEVPDQTIAQIAEAVLGTETPKVMLEQMAFAFAHELEDHFWNRQLDLGSSKEALTQKPIASDYVNRYEARAAKK